MVQWLSLLHNFIQQSLNSGSVQVQILFWLEIRLNAFHQSTILQKQSSSSFIDHSQMIDDVYENLEDYNQ